MKNNSYRYYNALCFIFQHTLLHIPHINCDIGVGGRRWAAINVNSYPMVVEMAKGSRCRKVHRILLYIFHGCTNTNTNLVRSIT